MTQLPLTHPAVGHAAMWLRCKLELDPNTLLEEEFEREFECRLQWDLPPGKMYGNMFPVAVEFDNEAAAMMFVMKWS